MFNKIRMMAVACGIAVVSENYLCFGGVDGSLNPGLGTGASGSVPTQGVDHANCISKDIVNGWKILGQSICDNGDLKDNLNNLFILKSVVDSDYKSKQYLKNIKVNDKQLLSDECDGISNDARQAIINNASADELQNNEAYKEAIKGKVAPNTYVLKNNLGKIKNANNKTLFANNDYAKVNDDYINGLSDEELGNNEAFKKLKLEKNDAINNASENDLKKAINFKNIVKNLTNEDLKDNAAYGNLVKQAALWSKDRLKDKHFDQNGNEDKTNTYIKVDDKTAIENTKTYKALKNMYEDVLIDKSKNDKQKNEEVEVGDRIVVEFSYGKQSRERYLVVVSNKSDENNISLDTIKKAVITLNAGKRGMIFKVNPGSVSFKAEKEGVCMVNVKVKYVLKQDKK